MRQLIIKVDDDFAEIPEGVNLSTVGQLVGSKSWFNKILILCLSDSTISELESQFSELELSWSVIAVEDEPLSLDEFSSYMNDIIIFDGEGQEVSSDPFRNSDLSTIQTFAGKNWEL